MINNLLCNKKIFLSICFILFIFSCEKIRPSFKIIMVLPLILPPFLNISGYLASIISLFILNFFFKEELNKLKN